MWGIVAPLVQDALKVEAGEALLYHSLACPKERRDGLSGDINGIRQRRDMVANLDEQNLEPPPAKAWADLVPGIAAVSAVSRFHSLIYTGRGVAMSMEKWMPLVITILVTIFVLCALWFVWSLGQYQYNVKVAECQRICLKTGLACASVSEIDGVWFRECVEASGLPGLRSKKLKVVLRPARQPHSKTPIT